MELTVLHPQTVHLPLAIAALLPFFHGGVWWAVSKGRYPRSVEKLAWIFAIIGFVSAGVAYWTGLQDAFYSSADMKLLERHKQAALWFCSSYSVVFLLISSQTFHNRTPVFIKVAVQVFLWFNLGLALWLGHWGGKIVFE